MKQLLVNKDFDNIINRGVFISGSARSGTTIFGKLFSTLKNVEYFFEPSMPIPIMLNAGVRNAKDLLEVYLIEQLLSDSMAGRNFNFNINDDSCIYNSKSEEEIKNTLSSSLRRKDLEVRLKNVIFSMKIPDLIFFMTELRELYPKTIYILMHRNPNDVINSLKEKGWFTDENMQKINLVPKYPEKIIDNIKIPYWIKSEDIEFWVSADELSRCVYYYKRISEEILKNSDSAIIIDYDEFIKRPDELFKKIVDRLSLDYGEKTQEILDTVKFQEKKRENYLIGLNSDLLLNIENLDKKLKELSVK